jgi:hypothetical protein
MLFVLTTLNKRIVEELFICITHHSSLFSSLGVIHPTNKFSLPLLALGDGAL